MPQIGQFPTVSAAHTIGNKAEKCFSACRPDTWVITNLGGTDDFGIDYQVQTHKNSQVTDIFRVQLKGTTAPDLNAEGTHISIQLKASTIRYYQRVTEPILLVVCDLSADEKPINCPLYYNWIDSELRRINAADLPTTQNYVTLHVPKANLLNDKTDLSNDLTRFTALAKIGQSMDITLEKRNPALSQENRSAILERVNIGVCERNIALMDALAEEPTTAWPAPAKNTIPWLLQEAKKYLNKGAIAKVTELLDVAAQKLAQAVPLEVGEYWFLKGRWHQLNLDYDAASDAFQKAIDAQPSHATYIASWAESKFIGAVAIDAAINFSYIHVVLTGSDPAILGIKARILAAEGHYVEAFEILATFAGQEQLATKAIIHTMRTESQEVIDICEKGLALENTSDEKRVLFHILKARAQFSLAVGMTKNPGNKDIYIPSTGTPDIDVGLLAQSWNEINIAMQQLRAAGWPSNLQFAVDILASMASILGKEEAALAILTEAAIKRPTIQSLQTSIEYLAIQTGKFKLALEANERLTQTSATKLRKTTLLHMAKRNQECVAFFEANLPDFDQSDPLFADGLAHAITSAELLVRGDLAKKWLALFDNHPEFAPRRAVLDYILAISRNTTKRQQALNAFIVSFEEHDKSLLIATYLFQELNPCITTEAESLLVVGEIIIKHRHIPLDDTQRLAQAYSALEKWPELLAFIENSQKWFDDNKILTAAKALALDKLGDTAQARKLLLPIIAQGTTDPFILNVHINIAIRCGLIEEAITTLERLVSSIIEPDKKRYYLQVLYNLIKAKNSSDSRLYDIVCRVGDLTDPGNELEEGEFLLMLVITTPSNDSEAGRNDEFQQRLSNYSNSYPNSKMIQSISIPNNASPDEFMNELAKITGQTPEKIAARRAFEDNFHKEHRYIPFCFRPKNVLSNVQDLPQLWEMMKQAQGHDPKLVLAIALPTWKEQPSERIRNQVPLMDITTLLLTNDLGIFELMFKLFPKIAISQATLLEIVQLCGPLTGSIAREHVLAIQKTIQANFEQILQPHASTAAMSMEFGIAAYQKEIMALSHTPPYLLYSDDAVFSIACSRNDPDFLSICTLDILTALEAKAILTSADVAEKICKLCDWGVLLVIHQRWQIASLPPALNEVKSPAEGIELIRRSACYAMFNYMWDNPGFPYQELQAHAAQLLSTMLCDPNRTNIAIAALMLIWHGKTADRTDTRIADVDRIGFLLWQTILLQTEVTVPFCTRLWEVCFLMTGHLQKETANADIGVETICQIASMAADVNLLSNRHKNKSVQVMLAMGLKQGTTEYLLFRRAYKMAHKL